MSLKLIEIKMFCLIINYISQYKYIKISAIHVIVWQCVKVVLCARRPKRYGRRGKLVAAFRPVAQFGLNSCGVRCAVASKSYNHGTYLAWSPLGAFGVVSALRWCVQWFNLASAPRCEQIEGVGWWDGPNQTQGWLRYGHWSYGLLVHYDSICYISCSWIPRIHPC